MSIVRYEVVWFIKDLNLGFFVRHPAHRKKVGRLLPPLRSKFRFLGYRGIPFQPFFHTFHVVLTCYDCRMAVGSSEACAFIAYVNLCINYVM